MAVSVFSFTPEGKALADRLSQSGLLCQLVHRPEKGIAAIQEAFVRGDRLVCICATGIVMRALAPLLKDKHQDPAVLVLDQQGRFVIPILSGHEGGANLWAFDIAGRIQATPVLTTAKPYAQEIITLGMGCEKGCPFEEVMRLVEECLAFADVPFEQVQGLFSLDLKAEEPAFHQLARQQNWAFECFTAEALQKHEPRLVRPSAYVKNTVGVAGVAEAAALEGLNMLGVQGGRILLPKTKNAKATCAIAQGYRLIEEA